MKLRTNLMITWISGFFTLFYFSHLLNLFSSFFPIFREEQFEIDFSKWQSTIERLEQEMHQFVRADIHQFSTSPLIALNHLKRFEDLNFQCLTIEQRYVDIVVAFVNNINTLKESYV